MNEDTVRDALRRVIDPELGTNIVDLNMVRQITIDGENIRVHLVLTAPGCPLAGWIVQEIRQTVGALSGVQKVEVELLDEPWEPPGNNWQSWRTGRQ